MNLSCFPPKNQAFDWLTYRDTIRISRIGYIRIKSCTFQDILQRFDSTNNEIALQSVFCIMKRNFFFFAKCRNLWLSTWRVFCLFLIDSHCQDIDLQQDYIYTRYMIIDHDIRDNFFSSKKVGRMQSWQEHLTMCECVQFLLFNIGGIPFMWISSILYCVDFCLGTMYLTKNHISP